MQPFLRPAASSPVSFAFLVALTAACQTVNPPDPNDEPNTDPPVDALEMSGHPGLEACTADLDAATVDLELDLARGFRDSISELVTCGQLAQGFVGNLIIVLVSVAAGADAHPTSFTYEGDGVYSVGVMRMSVRLAADTSWGAAGDVIAYDLFDPNNWFTELSASASGSIDLTGHTTTSLSIDFGGTAPLAELLGVAQGGAGSLEIDTDQIAARLGSLSLDTVILTDEEQRGAHFTWQIESPAGHVSDLLSNTAALPTQLEEVSGTHPTTGQSMVLGEWAIRYTTGHTGTTDGTVRFDVVGGTFDYTAELSYPHRREPDVALSCR